MFELIDGWFLRALNDTSNPFLKISVAARADREGLRHVKIKRDCPRFFSLSTVILKNRVFFDIFYKILQMFKTDLLFTLSKKICKNRCFFPPPDLTFLGVFGSSVLGFPDFRLLRP